MSRSARRPAPRAGTSCAARAASEQALCGSSKTGASCAARATACVQQLANSPLCAATHASFLRYCSRLLIGMSDRVETSVVCVTSTRARANSSGRSLRSSSRAAFRFLRTRSRCASKHSTAMAIDSGVACHLLSTSAAPVGGLPGGLFGDKQRLGILCACCDSAVGILCAF